MPKEQKINLNTCPKCKSRTTKIYDLSSEHPYECQVCRTHYSKDNYLQIKKETK